MQRDGPRGTIPPPSERHRAGPRWPLQVIVGLLVVAAALFGMRLLRHPSEPAPQDSGRSPAESVDVAHPGVAREPAPIRPAAASVLDGEFMARLRLADTHRLLGDIGVSADVLALLAEQRLAEAARALDTQARANDRTAVVALARLAHACTSGAPDTPGATESDFSHAAQRARDLSTEARLRIEASITFIRERRATMKKACADTRFDAQAIADRLRRAAAAGDEMSLWELGNEASAEAQRKHWTSAAMLGYVPAQVSLAQSLMSENLDNDPRLRDQLSFWLTSAARQSPRGKTMLAECMLNGCGVKPPDGSTAASLLEEAVLSGTAEALAPLQSIGGDDPAAPTDAQLFSLNAFLQRLNERGCYGEFYPGYAVNSHENQQQLALRLSPSGLEEAQRLTDGYWRDHGAQALSTLHCN
ncbi:MAG TPA: hypothetical protein VH542_06595 [Steroidobacteraceae bacterium]